MQRGFFFFLSLRKFFISNSDFDLEKERNFRVFGIFWFVWTFLKFLFVFSEGWRKTEDVEDLAAANAAEVLEAGTTDGKMVFLLAIRLATHC